MTKLKVVVLLACILGTTLVASSAQAKDLKIWDQLKGTNPTGYVLLMRHTLAPGIGDPDNFQVNDCSTQRNLNEEGRQDAREIGRWLVRREVKILGVESSRWCRAKETAQLLNIGKVRLNKNLDSLFRVSDPLKDPQTANIKKRILDHRKVKGLLVMVGHSVNFQALTNISLESGEGVLIRATAQGKLEVMGYSPAP